MALPARFYQVTVGNDRIEATLNGGRENEGYQQIQFSSTTCYEDRQSKSSYTLRCYGEIAIDALPLVIKTLFDVLRDHRGTMLADIFPGIDTRVVIEAAKPERQRDETGPATLERAARPDGPPGQRKIDVD